MSATPVARYALESLIQIVPVLTQLDPYRDINLNTWRIGGSYQLTHSTKADFTLIVNHREFAASLIADVQHLLNQVLEHRAHLLQALQNHAEPSPTWMFVGLYYLGLYAAMAWTRVNNSGIVYLDKEAVAKYCQGATVKPGAGSFLVKLTVASAGSQAQVHFSKTSTSHFHEAVWAAAVKESGAAYAWIERLSASRTPSQDELISLRAMKLIRDAPFASTAVWPSKLRNALNYRPGFSYRGVPNNNILRIKSRLKKQPFSDLDALVSYGERALILIGRTKSPSDVPNEAVDLLLSVALIFEKYVDEALIEIASIQGLRSAAHAERTRFSRVHCRGTFSLLNTV